MVILLEGIRSHLSFTGDIFLNGELLNPLESMKIIHFSCKFAWGYNLSGANQLALAILLKFTDEKTALRNYERFRLEVVEKIYGEKFKKRIDISKYIERNEYETS